jgi:ferritin-like metal-binding protein YciE
MKADPVGELCEGALGLFHETWELLKRCTDPQVADAAVITAIQHLHHHDIAGYGTLCAFSKALELDEIAHELHDMLEDEKSLDKLLSEMAKNSINRRANNVAESMT